MSYKVLDIARYTINYSIKQNKPISNIKLQKLLYYIQANFIVKKGQVCFNENIMRTKYGAFINVVYNEFDLYGSMNIEDMQLTYEIIEYNKEKTQIEIVKKKFDDNIITDEDKKLINEVVDSYSNYNAMQITSKSLKEKPCRITELRDIIDNDLIHSFYTDNKDKILGSK